MAIIKCTECSEEISDKAESCPQCGVPVRGSKVVKAVGVPVTTIQKTSKSIKGWGLFFKLGLVASLLATPALSEAAPLASALAAMATLICFVGIFWTRVRRWWHHD